MQNHVVHSVSSRQSLLKHLDIYWKISCSHLFLFNFDGNLAIVGLNVFMGYEKMFIRSSVMWKAFCFSYQSSILTLNTWVIETGWILPAMTTKRQPSKRYFVRWFDWKNVVLLQYFKSCFQLLSCARDPVNLVSK